MRSPAVSVIIPTRNRASLLPVAIRSALGQTFRDLEVIVVDDASEDGTAQAVNALSDARLRYIRQDVPRGGSAARNAGIRAAKGEYVAYLDDDDEWLPEKLEKQVNVFRAGGAKLGVVYASYVVVDRESGRVLARKIAEKRGDLAREILRSNFVGGASAVIMKRECFEKAGLFDEALPSYQDYDLWIRTAKHFEFDFVAEVLSNYFVHGHHRIWRDPGALSRGIEIMLEKHGTARPLRRNLSYASLGLGAQFCDGGNCSKGRAAICRAIRLYPFEFRHYFHLALCLLGNRAYKAVTRVKHRVLSRVRKRASGVGPDDERAPVVPGPGVLESDGGVPGVGIDEERTLEFGRPSQNGRERGSC